MYSPFNCGVSITLLTQKSHKSANVRKIDAKTLQRRVNVFLEILDVSVYIMSIFFDGSVGPISDISEISWIFLNEMINFFHRFYGLMRQFYTANLFACSEL